MLLIMVTDKKNATFKIASSKDNYLRTSTSAKAMLNIVHKNNYEKEGKDYKVIKWTSRCC